MYFSLQFTLHSFWNRRLRFISSTSLRIGNAIAVYGMTTDVLFVSTHVISVDTKVDIGVRRILGALFVPSRRGILFLRGISAGNNSVT